MKRTFALLLALTMTALLFACTAPATEADPSPTLASTEGPQLITNVDDFLAAIAPGAEILLGEGDFILSEATGYGKSSNSCYTWDSLGNGDYALALQDVEGLTIRGCGQNVTRLLTQPQMADVLKLRGCKNIVIEDITLGHQTEAEACEGGVLYLDRCESITAAKLGLFGCGSLGVHAVQCQGVTLQECEIYDCSIAGAAFNSSTDVLISSCTIHSLGKDMSVSAAFSFWGGNEATITNCMIASNYVDNLVSSNPGDTLTFRDNQFVSNAITQAAFSFWSENVVLEGNVFEDNTLRNWYAKDTFPALDLEGSEVIFEDPQAALPPAPAEATPVTTGPQTEVYISTADDFIKAVSSDTCIILDAALIDFSTASGYAGCQKALQNTTDSLPTYSDPLNEHCFWMDNFDGPSLVITGVNNLTIKAEGDDREAHTLSAVPRYADVLTFEQCSAVTLSGFTAGHTIQRGSCTGGVFLMRNCEDILIENCGMYGCGTEGFNGEFCRNIQIINSEIYECSVAGIELSRCENVTIAGTVLRDIDNDYHFRFYGNTDVTLDGNPLDGNYHGN